MKCEKFKKNIQTLNAKHFWKRTKYTVKFSEQSWIFFKCQSIFLKKIFIILIKISQKYILLKFIIILTFMKQSTKPNTYTFNLI